MSKDTQPAMTYPTVDQYDRWKAEANEMDMSISEWMQAMIEAGQKKFNASVEPDETAREIREERNELRDELKQARERIQELEDRIYERDKVSEFVRENPGCEFGEIVEHIRKTTPSRVTQHLETNERIEHRNGQYYPVGWENGEAQGEH